MKKSNKMLIALLSMALAATASFAACNSTPDDSGSGNSNIEQPCSIELNKSILTLEEGKTETLTVSGNNGETVEWSSSDSTVATVVDGVVTALKKGTATITVTCGESSATCVLSVVEPIVLTLDESELMLFEGETATLTVTASNGAEYTYEWTSTNPDVASVENGVVTAISEGTTVIKAQFGDKTVECEVTVQKEIVVMVLDNSNMTLKVGATGTLTATCSDGSTPAIEWLSSDNEVASVENGVVTGLTAGTCTITAKAGELSATCTVVVEDTYELLFPELPEMVYVGEELELGIVLKKNGETQDVEDATITGEGFTVEAGKVTTTKSGNIEITATYNGISTTKTIASYIKVSTVEDFKAIANDLSGWYKLTSNLDFNGETFNAFSSYKTKNANGKTFTGIFDGNGYSISNMVVGYNTTDSSDRDRSIFGYMENGAIVRNVAFVGMKGADRAAVVASWCEKSTIENVYVDFTYTSKGGNNSTSNPSGIIVAKLQAGGVIKNSVVKLTIATGAFDEGYMGCIVGANNNGQIENCQAIYTPNNAETETLNIVYSTPGAGSVVTASKVYGSLSEFYNTDTGADLTAYGELWKFAEGYEPYLANMTDTINVTADGQMYQGTSLNITAESSYGVTVTLKDAMDGVTLEGNVLTVANTVAKDTEITIVVSSVRFPELSVEHTVTIMENAYAATSTETSVTIDTGIIGETTKNLGIEVTLNGTKITEGYEIVSENTSVVTVSNGVITVVGEGATNINVVVNDSAIYTIPVVVTNAYNAIRTVDEFKAIDTDATTRAKKYMLMNDIDFKGAEFAGFGSQSVQTPGNTFVGVFDGNGYSLRNIKPAQCATSGSTADRSIFGVLGDNAGAGATVRNLSIVGAEIDGWGGVLASYVLKNVLIENCYVDVTVTGTNSVKSTNDIGAFVFRLQANATIRNCISVVTVANGVDTTYVGAVIGMNLGKIENCQAIVLSDNEMKVFTSEHASVKGTVSNSAVYAGVDAFYNTESGADLTKYGDIWVIEQGKLPRLNKMADDEELTFECNDSIYQGTSAVIETVSKYGATLTLKETIEGVSLVDNVLTVDSTVDKDTVIVLVLTSKYYSNVSVEKEITVAEISYEVTSTETTVTMDTVIIGETTKDLGITVKTNGQVVTEGYEIVSDNTAVVTVVNGVITVVGEGTANINVTVNGTTIYTIPVTVTNAYNAIRTIDEFKAINTDATTRAKKYMLMQDIDFKGAEFAGFSSQKDQSKPFAGVFDGNGYKLMNIKPVQCATSGSTADRSIFGVLGIGAQIRNLSIVGAEMTGWGGVLASYVLKEAVIENCYVEVTVTGTDSVKSAQDIGAFVWRLQANATIRNCISVVKVATDVDTTYVAGIVGMNLGKIENCQTIVTSENELKVFTSEHASVKGTVSNSVVYAGVDAFYNTESGADLTKYDTTNYWTFDATNKTVALKKGCTVEATV